ncbi:hypothetical protein GCM10010168_43980 [Actinoplanes ianthinogenes]|uniref:Uncharacterized protein n=1 Tax=Actinoplanes ianthinogenes TaxID=122358 RepID=A0ABN6CGW1_9ACTN|nr:hypothetical protein [Actinoplanes ianthinogenes]BCJ43293.1 hypothetical protein Aiant_39500 [Actinoplanes ianthinogenes]GGR21130.1 hypothetical protein GCM10010168_43980 [Actinoplanes ianthinogenes]
MVQVSISPDGDDLGVMQVILEGGTWVLQVLARPEELVTLRSIREADWAARRALRVGTVFGVSVFWAFKDDIVTALVGQDDETWQIAMTMPVEAVDRLAAMAVDHLPGPEQPEPDPPLPYPGQLEIF